MSRESKKKQFHTQLENLFVDLEEETHFQALSKDTHVPGWEWVCDEEGRYVTCSAEMQAILGFNPQDFLGKKISSFSVASNSIADIEAALQANEFPVDVDTQFHSANGHLVDIQLQIFERTTTNGSTNGWHGFAQKVDTKTEPVAEPIADAAAPEPIIEEAPLETVAEEPIADEIESELVAEEDSFEPVAEEPV
ncbi:MAG: PAS domain S-box protein, partial [Anaerolineales bacterium]|nr:PAS domain S-box protein [Anaerolineales bacterium]